MKAPVAINKRTTRSPGRPVGQVSSVRETLLDSALLSFANEGIAQTNQRKIALISKTTPAMVNYHFGDKKGLVKAVMEERVRSVIESVQGEFDAAKQGGGLATLEKAMRAFVTAATVNPLVPKLVLREVYSENGALRHTFMSSYGTRLIARLIGVIKKAQQEGSIRAELNSERIAFSFMSLTIYPVLSSPMVPELLGLPVTADNLIQQAEQNFNVFIKGVS